MKQLFPFFSASAAAALLALAPALASAQTSLTWEQAKAKFEAANPALKADALGVDEMRAAEITAFLRPNPQLSFTMDQLYPFGPHYDPNVPGTYNRPLSNALTTGSVTYLYEREHKRDLRLRSAKEGTQIAQSEHADLERNLIFNLRAAFVQTLQSKRVVELAKADLAYYDNIIKISRDRFRAGDLAQIDLDRIELLRVQYESELQTALVDLRTSKIQLLQLLDDRTPVEQFDVTGLFDFSDELKPLDDFRQIALDERPDLRAALESIQQAQTNHKLAIANGSADPTFGVDSGANPPLDPYVGFNISIPLRIFDRNQGEKQRTEIDIGRDKELTEATREQVFSDVDSAYAQVESSLALLRPYKAQYNDQALRVRDTVTYSYQHGGASLMDFLNAQSDFRAVQLAYVQLIGSYLTAAGQLNLAVGREVIQ
ncbi:MAG: TolC family protein [Terracidiphilus sp.]|jgi:cobalt-zinc-cadmium efflux system outer membrane protein